MIVSSYVHAYGCLLLTNSSYVRKSSLLQQHNQEEGNKALYPALILNVI